MLVICMVLDLFTVEENDPIKSCTLVCAFQILGLFTVTKPQSHNNVKGPVISKRDFSTAPPSTVTAAAGSG